MGIALAIISIVVAILLAIIPGYFKKWKDKPNIDLELIPNGGGSKPLGYSNKNNYNKSIDLDIEEAIKVFELEYKFKIRLRNNSNFVAYYPKLKTLNNVDFTEIEELNNLIPISNSDDIILKAKYIKVEECKGFERTKIKGIPIELENLKIQIEFKNHSGVTFYKLFDLSNKENSNKFINSPIED